MPIISNLEAPGWMPDATQGQQPKLFDDVRNVLRLHHYSIHTERAYVDWIVRFVRFRGCHHYDLHPRPPAGGVRVFRVPWMASVCELSSCLAISHASRGVTLNPSTSLRINSVKGLSERFFAALRMTALDGRLVKCTNVMHSGLVDGYHRAIGPVGNNIILVYQCPENS